MLLTTRVRSSSRHDIVPGTVINGRWLRISRIHADDGVLASLFDASAINEVRGQVAIARVPAGSLLTHDDVRPVSAGHAPRAMSFPIPIPRAVGGALVAGDRVDVLSVRHNTGRTSYVATDVQVLAFSRNGGSPLQGSEDASITLAVDPDAAARIASALETGSVTLVRATGASETMSEPEIALVFTAEPWVEELHRYLSDHGGARVRSLVVEQSVALEESYDVLVVSHRWPALTHAFVADVHARSRRVLGVHERTEPASRAHLATVNVDAVVENDAGPEAFVRALVQLCSEQQRHAGIAPAARRVPGRLVGIGGPPGVGRTEIAIELAVAAARDSSVLLADCDDVAPAVAQRLALPLEPNLRTAIDAVEHGRGDLAACIQRHAHRKVAVLGGIPSSTSWMQVRPGEVIRVVDRLGTEAEIVVVDGIGSLQDLGGLPRGRFATARALAVEADVLVAVCDASPVGITRLLAWTVEVRTIAPSTPIVVAVNRAPSASFRRGELYDEITSSIDVIDVQFVGVDSRVVAAAWEGRGVARGRFTRAVSRVWERVGALPRRMTDARLVAAS